MTSLNQKTIALSQSLRNLLSSCIYHKPLYHYCGLESCLGMICNHVQWMKRTDLLMDQCEGLPLSNFIELALQELGEEGTALNAELRLALRIFCENESDYAPTQKVYISCYSTRKDDVDMWNDFADESRGCCISISSKKLPQEYIAAKVIYDDKEKVDLIKSIILELNQCPASDDYTLLIEYTLVSLRYLFKPEKFQQEHEVRLIYLDDGSLTLNQEPFAHANLPFSEHFISSVTLGDRIWENNSENLRRLQPFLAGHAVRF